MTFGLGARVVPGGYAGDALLADHSRRMSELDRTPDEVGPGFRSARLLPSSPVQSCLFDGYSMIIRAQQLSICKRW